MQMIMNLFRPPLAKDLAKRQLEEYERQLLVHQAATGYHTKMAEYYTEGIARLGKRK